MELNQQDLSYGMVAYIDLLGFSKQVRKVEFLEDLGRLVSKVMSIQHEFDEDSESQETVKKEVVAFSDCMIVSISAESDLAKLQGTYDVWLCELSTLALSQYRCVLRGHVLRGGLSDGWWYHNKQNVIVSPALVESVEIESEKACWPIIVLSDSLVSYFTEQDNWRAYSDDPTKALLLTDTEKGFWYIDYLGYAVEELGWHANKDIIEEYKRTPVDERKAVRTKGWKANAKAALSRHREVLTSAYRSAPDQRAKAKYTWLAQYHNSVVERYNTTFEDLKTDIGS